MTVLKNQLLHTSENKKLTLSHLNAFSKHEQIKENKTKNSFSTGPDYKEIVNSLNKPFLLIKNNGAIVDANKAALCLFGYSLEDLIKIGCDGIFLKKDGCCYKELLGGNVENKDAIEITGIRRNGENFNAEFSSALVRDTGNEYISIILNEIKKINGLNAETLLIQNTEAPLLLIDNNLNIVTFNNPFLSVFKSNSHIVLKKGNSILSYFPPEKKEYMVRFFGEVLDGNQKKEQLELNEGDGILKNIFLKYTPVRNEKGVIQGVLVSTVDIPNEPASAYKLEESEIIYHKLFRDNPVPMWILDYETRQFLKVNEQAIIKYGYTRTEFLSMTSKQIRPVEDIKKIDEIIYIRRANLDIYKGIWTHILKNGERIKVEITSHKIKYEEKNALFIMALDVTEKLKAEEEKDFEKREKEALINSTTDQIWSIGRNFELIAANRSFIEILKAETGIIYKPGDSLMMHPFTGNFLQIWREDYYKALAGESITKEKFIPVSANLPARWVEFIFSPIFRENKVTAIACFSRNITERKLAEEKLKYSESMLAEAQKLAKLGNWSHDLVTDTVSWSEELYDIFGLDKNLGNIRPESFIDYVENTDKDRVKKVSDQTKETGDSFSIVYHINTPGGAKKIIEENGYGLKDATGKVIRMFGTAQDITESKLAEESIRDSNERYNLVAKATNDSIWDWNIITGKFTRTGSAFKTLFGYEIDEANDAEFIYRNLIHPEDLTRLKESQMKSFSDPEKSYWEEEFRYLKADGEYAYVYDRGFIIRDARGKPIRMIGASQDITVQKKQVNEIIRIQQNLHSLINTTDDLIWSVNKELKIITANKAFRKVMQSISGNATEEGDNVLLNTSDHVLQHWKSLYKKVLEGENFSIEEENYDKATNSFRCYMVSLFRMQNIEGDTTGVACFAKDISEIKKAASKLEKSEKRFSDLFHTSPQPMWVYDPETYRFVEVNNSCIEQYGYTEEEFLNMTIMDIRPKEEIAKTMEVIEKRRKQKFQNMDVTFRHHKKNGEIMDVQISSTPISINDKWYTSVIAIDITEKKRYEQKITKAIIKAQENERYEIGGELHDNVCQLLATSKMGLGVLQKSLPELSLPLIEQSKEYISMALDEIRNLSHRLAPAFFNDITLEEAFRKLFSTFNMGDKYEIVLQFDEKLQCHSINQEMRLNLYRILQEQLRNIVKYSKASLIEVNVSCSHNKLTMKVIDNGIGFDTETIKEGIGLSNMKRRTELFYGKFDVQSSPGNGCEIIVEIPLEEGV